MTTVRAMTLLSLVFTMGCGDISIPSTDSGEGSTCTKTANCNQGLECIASKCVDQTKGGTGATCTKTADCQVPLQCISGACGDQGPGPNTACPATCISDSCCKLRSTGLDPLNECGECLGDAQCHPQATGYSPDDPCPRCSPASVAKVNGQPIDQAPEPFQKCLCDVGEDLIAYNTCLESKIPGFSSNNDCNTCFIDYFKCLEDNPLDICDNCNICGGDTVVTSGDANCYKCTIDSNCGEILNECTGGVQW